MQVCFRSKKPETTFSNLKPLLLVAHCWHVMRVLSNVGAGDVIRGLRSPGCQPTLIITHAESLRVGLSGQEIGYSIFSALYKYPE